MNGDLEPYAALKESGLPWLSEVPAHWEVRKLRRILTRVTERGQPELPLLSVVRERGVIRRDATNQDENRNYIPDDLSNYKVVQVGQFAMNKMKAWQGSYGVSRHEGIVSPAYFVFDVSGLDGTFFHAAIRSKAYVSFFTQASDGVRIGQWDLAEVRMREIPFLVPPLSEQAAIVFFLDHADRRIRRYIASKKKLIGLLNEQKQAVINGIFARGADANAGLKASGLPWWPLLPENFTQARLGRDCRSIRDGTHDPPAATPGVHRLLSVRNVVAGKFVTRDDDRTMSPEAYAELQRSYTLQRGDIVLALVGATTGKSAMVGETENLTVQRSLGIIRPDQRRIESAFLILVLRSELVQAQIRSEMTKGLCTKADRSRPGSGRVTPAERVSLADRGDPAGARDGRALAGGARAADERAVAGPWVPGASSGPARRGSPCRL